MGFYVPQLSVTYDTNLNKGEVSMNKKNETSIEERSRIMLTEENEKTRDVKKKEPGEALFTIQEVADYWRVHPRTVYDAIRFGKLRAFKAGSAWRISCEALKDYEEEQSKACRYCQQTELQKMLKNSKGEYTMKIH